jgi:hypothetical protein
VSTVDALTRAEPLAATAGITGAIPCLGQREESVNRQGAEERHQISEQCVSALGVFGALAVHKILLAVTDDSAEFFRSRARTASSYWAVSSFVRN